VPVAGAGSVVLSFLQDTNNIVTASAERKIFFIKIICWFNE
jgi:hypothetical protein